MNLTITGYSTALFSTWYLIEELGLLFDCGDGLTSSILQKSRKIEHAFITHADRDHLTGLLQFLQLNSRPGFPLIHYPKDCGSFSALQDFTSKFDQHTTQAQWIPIKDRSKIWIRKDMYVEAIRNNHVPCENTVHKSLGYRVVQVKSKLKPEYINLSSGEIKAVIERLGKEATHTELETTILSYSGDTPCENFEYWDNAEILIHEATFLGTPEDQKIQTHGNKHSYLEEVIKSASEIKLGCLILGHFSSRYSNEQIDSSIRANCEKYGLNIPVYRILPGQVVKNILNTHPIYG